MSSLRSIRVTTIPKDSELEPFVSEIVHFDRKGNEIARYEYKGPGEFESKTETKFNEQGRVMEETTYQDEDEIMERKTFTRNELGIADQIHIEYSDGSYAIQRVERGPDTENWIEEDEEGELESREFLKFDSAGRVILRESYDYRDKLTEAIEYEYDGDGKQIKRRQFDERRKLLLETEFRYNESGQLILRASRNRKGDLSDYLKIEYNEMGKPIRQVFSGKVTYLFEYDQNGNPIVEEHYIGDSLLEDRITFEYDANNRVVLEEQTKLTKQYEYEYFEGERG
jgi:hypothetical protein